MGIAWYTQAGENYTKGVSGTRPGLYKSQSPPFNDFNFRSLCANTETNCVFAHIRAASGSLFHLTLAQYACNIVTKLEHSSI